MKTNNSVVPALNPSVDSITIGGVTIHKSTNNLYLLTDLWKASGKRSAKLPEEWLRLKSTKELINELQQQNPVSPINQSVIEVIGGNAEYGAGTYVCEDLVYSYAMWVNPKFALIVIRAFKELTTAATVADLIDTKHRLDNAIQTDLFNPYQQPRDRRCLQVIMKCSSFQANQYHDELVGKGILGFRHVDQSPRRVYYARKQHPAIIGSKGETILFNEVELKKLFPTQIDFVEFVGGAL